jgi:hypothetical protein
MASSTLANLEANKGRVRFKWCEGAPRIREGAEGEVGWSTATSTFPMAIYPKLRALRQWIRLGCKVERMSRREGVERGKNGRHGKLRARGSAFILIPGLGVYGALVGRDWTARAVLQDGVVR